MVTVACCGPGELRTPKLSVSEFTTHELSKRSASHKIHCTSTLAATARPPSRNRGGKGQRKGAEIRILQKERKGGGKGGEKRERVKFHYFLPIFFNLTTGDEYSI